MGKGFLITSMEEYFRPFTCPFVRLSSQLWENTRTFQGKMGDVITPTMIKGLIHWLPPAATRLRFLN